MQATTDQIRPNNLPFGTGVKANRLKTTKQGGKLVNDYWENLFAAKDDGRKVIWYNGTYIPPFFHAHNVAWVHGEAWSAYLAACLRHFTGPFSHGFNSA